VSKIGDKVDRGDVLAVVEYRNSARLDAALPLLKRAWRIGEAASEPDLVIGRIN
jgi:thymidine phosphorylase